MLAILSKDLGRLMFRSELAAERPHAGVCSGTAGRLGAAAHRANKGDTERAS
jgi:hypothetical protein